MKIITITNQKGGSGKTTTTNAVMAGLSKKGFKVLAIDLDPQGNFSFTLKSDENKPSILDVLTGKSEIKNSIQKSTSGDFISSSKFLSNADMLFNETGKEYKLKEVLEEIKENYDFILLDTPPALNTLTVNALTACNSVIIPAQADIYSMQGVDELNKTITSIRKYCNKDLEISGILLTRYNDRTLLSRTVKELASKIAKNLGSKVFNTTIREGIAIKEAQFQKQNVFEYSEKSNVATDYNNFIDEILEK